MALPRALGSDRIKCFACGSSFTFTCLPTFIHPSVHQSTGPAVRPTLVTVNFLGARVPMV